MYFRKPWGASFRLSREVKADLMSQVDRSSPAAKVADFFERAIEMIHEMEYGHQLQLYWEDVQAAWVAGEGMCAVPRGVGVGAGMQSWGRHLRSKRLGRRLEEVATAVGGGCAPLQMPLSLALAVRGTVAGHRLAPWRGGVPPPPSNASLWGGGFGGV